METPKGPGLATKIVVTICMVSFFVWAISCSIKNDGKEHARKMAEGRGTSNADAMEKCQRLVKANATYPSSVDFFVLGGGTTKDQATGKVVVTAPFEAKNGMGNLLPQSANCTFDATGRIIDLTITNR